MKKKILAVLLVTTAALLCFSQEVLFQKPVPKGLDLEPIHFGKSVFLDSLPDGGMLVGLVGRVAEARGMLHGEGRKEGRTTNEPRVFQTVLWVIDDTGTIRGQQTIPGYVFRDLLQRRGEIGRYARLTQMVWAGGNDLSSCCYYLMDGQGDIVGKWEHLNGRSVEEAVVGDGIACYLRDADWYGKEFELVPLSSLLEPTSQEKETKGQRPRSVTVRFKDHSPSAFLYLGGPEMDYVVAFGGTIWRESAATQQIKWKVDDIGAPIQQIRTTDGVTLDIETEKLGIVVLDAETGTTVAALDSAHPVVKGGTLALFGTHYEKGWFVNVDFKHGRKVMLNSDTGETRTQLVAQPAVRSDQTGMTVRTIGGTTYRLEVKDGIVRLQMLPSSGSATN